MPKIDFEKIRSKVSGGEDESQNDIRLRFMWEPTRIQKN